MNRAVEESVVKVAQSLVKTMGHHWKHVSFIVRRNSIVALGVNQPFKTHPLAHKFEYRYNAIHSELAAILNFEKPIRELCKYDFVNVRIDKFGKPKLSAPCKRCKNLLASFGVHRVYYTNNEGSFSCCTV